MQHLLIVIMLFADFSLLLMLLMLTDHFYGTTATVCLSCNIHWNKHDNWFLNVLTHVTEVQL